MTNVVLLNLVFFIPATCGLEKRAATSAGGGSKAPVPAAGPATSPGSA